MNPRICVSISPTDETELLGSSRKAEELAADFLEIRLDKLRSYRGLSNVVRSSQKPLIATNRARPEKGSFDGPEAERLKILKRAVEEGFQYVDLEFKTSNLERTIRLFKGKGAKIILSHHDHFRTPAKSTLAATLAQLKRFKPDVCKIVTTAHHPDDNLAILDLLKTNRRSTPLVSFAMGKKGVWSRLLAPFYGAYFTYASLERGQETAPGQPPISELRRIYEMLEVE